MSRDHSFVVKVESARVDARRTVAVGITAVVIIFGSALWVRADLPARHVIDAGVEGRAPEQLHGVLQTIVGADRSTERLTEEKRRQLQAYAWVDEKSGVIRIPIDEAMKLVEEGQ